MIRNENVSKLEHMAAGWLQRLYSNYQRYLETCGEDNVTTEAAWCMYDTACKTLESFGCDWWRHATKSEDGKLIVFSHCVNFPTNQKCMKLNENVWDS